MIILVLVLVTAYLGMNLLVRRIYPKQLFPYRGSSYEDAGALLRTTASGGNDIVLAYLPTDDPEAPLLLYFHGNGEDIGHNSDRFEWFRSLGYAVLAPDYPGYGLSGGEPTPDSVRAAAEAALALATGELGRSPDDIVLWGRSVGGGPAIHLATVRDFRGLILESAFRSVFSLAVPFPLVIPEPFANERLLTSVETPVYLFHGEADRIIPVSHAFALRDAASGSAELFLYPEGTHNDLRFVGGRDMETVLERLRDRSVPPAHD